MKAYSSLLHQLMTVLIMHTSVRLTAFTRIVDTYILYGLMSGLGSTVSCSAQGNNTC